jgi:hypothetical protein
LEKTGFFVQKSDSFCKNRIIYTTGFLRKRPIFPPKLTKIAENCENNIDPRSHWLWPMYFSPPKSYDQIPCRDSISRPITPVSSVAGGDNTTRPRRQGKARN